ncbi:AFL173Cp [Eremothecium gossypii ATCC 10895]|uniref:AFL173Cp n=1 Tax=Eremothecium gossypii (strain ATCC 10895 / CBS 109.51 / FGSC 9923 / NRRL Y-1056) TaxID=284811 RepID=Q755J6_EREGS|nr:AFL173Cp [Eremothecium gossypii ATCC 10895]AAS53201.2 AFL173Cp [Eremothecium gossypii ATCC 10895]AEY97511.1 FAFL173Cp [Eremothecium gossypii FDAG1]
MRGWGNVWYSGPWALLVHAGHACLFHGNEAVEKWPVVGQVRCNFSEDAVHLVVYAERAFQLQTVQLATRRRTEQAVVSVAYGVARFEVLWQDGIIVAMDGVGGRVHCVDTRRQRTLGCVQTNADDGAIYVVGARAFQVFVRQLDKATATEQLFFNTYELGADGAVRLQQAVRLGSSAGRHFAARLGNVFAVVLSCPFTRRSALSLHVDGQPAPLAQLQLPFVHDAAFCDHWTLALALDARLALLRPLAGTLAAVPLAAARVHNGPARIIASPLGTPGLPDPLDSPPAQPSPPDVVPSLCLLTARPQHIAALFAARPNWVYLWSPPDTSPAHPRLTGIILPDALVAATPDDRYFAGSYTAYTLR